MKTISPVDLGMIELSQQRARKHNMHMSIIETVRGKDLDDAIIVCIDRKQSFHTWKFMRNQLQNYTVTRELGVYANMVNVRLTKNAERTAKKETEN